MVGLVGRNTETANVVAWKIMFASHSFSQSVQSVYPQASKQTNLFFSLYLCQTNQAHSFPLLPLSS